MLDALLERFRRGDRLALARLLTLLARGEHLSEILAGLSPPAEPARVVAVTGSGGVGKSSLVGKLLEHLRNRGQTVAVLACDPQSPLSGGALLGDRFRMPARPQDDGVFIRSLAAVSGRGAVAEHLHAMVRLLEAFGFGVILIETVGAGQGETAVRELADVVVLLLQPETGDDLQWEKAGILEVADVIVVHKADLPGAEQVEAQVRASVALSGGSNVPVLRVSSKTGQGIAELCDALTACSRRRTQPADLSRRPTGGKPRITQIPLPGGSGRIPTGALQFQGDWPGLFLRGDNAIALLYCIRSLSERLGSYADPVVRDAVLQLGQLADLIGRDVVVGPEEPAGSSGIAPGHGSG